MLTVWPLIERYRIFQKGVTADPNKTERDKIPILEKKFQTFADSDDLTAVFDHPLDSANLAFSFMNPYDLERGVFFSHTFPMPLVVKHSIII